jgi:hypothetical protein
VKPDCTILFRLVAFAVGVCFVCSVSVAADGWAEYQAAKQKALVPLQAQYERIVAAHRDDPAVRKYQERLGLVDEVAAQVLKALDAISAASAASVMDTVSGDPAGVKPLAADVQGHPASDALRIFASYRSVFEEELLGPNLPEEDQVALRKYASLGMSVAAASVAERGPMIQTVATSDEFARQAVCLAAVLPLLSVRDDKWFKAEIESLPGWMRTAPNYQALEMLSLRAQRPLTAWQFALPGGQPPTGRGDRLGYMLSSVARLVGGRDYGAATFCCSTGAQFAKAADAPSMAAAFDLEFARVLGSSGRPSEAAAKAKTVLSDYPNTELWGRAAVLRLRYLCQAGLFEHVLAEAVSLRRDRRCRDYLPPILYIQWVASGKLQHRPHPKRSWRAWKSPPAA